MGTRDGRLAFDAALTKVANAKGPAFTGGCELFVFKERGFDDNS